MIFFRISKAQKMMGSKGFGDSVFVFVSQDNNFFPKNNYCDYRRQMIQ